MMMFKLSVTFLNGTFHGCGDQREPEWPPSPLRVFQALVAVADVDSETETQALNWLGALKSPEILAPAVHIGVPYQSSVPNNAMDLVANLLGKGSTSDDANPAKHRTMKNIRTTHLLAEPAQQQTHYLWSVPEDQTPADDVLTALRELVSRVYAVGWGLDLAAGHAEFLSCEEKQELSGQRWQPVEGGRVSLRVPGCDTLQALRTRHSYWLGRMSSEKTLSPVPALPPTMYRTVSYACAGDATPPPVAAFSLLKRDASGYRTYLQTKGTEVAGMLRHLTAEVARQTGRSQSFIDQIALGHGEPKASPSGEKNQHQPVGLNRLAYVPLPSLEPRQKGGKAFHAALIRRCLLYIPQGGEKSNIEWLRRSLPGNELIPATGKDPDTMLSLLPASDRIVRRYLAPKVNWASVTPVVLPGQDDRKSNKTEKLIRKAIRQAGLPEAVAELAVVNWSKACFWPGGAHADRYFFPKHLRNFPRYHVQISFADAQKKPLELPGPIVLGGGRFFGLGLLAGVT